jgi:hypothetical protein
MLKVTKKNPTKPESVEIQRPVNPFKSNVVYIGGYPKFWWEHEIWLFLIEFGVIIPDYDFITIDIGWDNGNPYGRKNATIFFSRMESAQTAVGYLDGLFVQDKKRISVTYKVSHGDVSPSGKVYVDGINPSYCLKGKKKIFDWHSVELQLKLNFAKYGDIYHFRINTLADGSFLYDSKGFNTATIWYYNPESAEIVKDPKIQLPFINKKQVVLMAKDNSSPIETAEKKTLKMDLRAKAMH